MVQLVLVYCLAADARSCIEKRPQMEIGLSAQACMMEAQPIAADWLRDHPDYELSGFRCEIDKPDEKQL